MNSFISQQHDNNVSDEIRKHMNAANNDSKQRESDGVIRSPAASFNNNQCKQCNFTLSDLHIPPRLPGYGSVN